MAREGADARLEEFSPRLEETRPGQTRPQHLRGATARINSNRKRTHPPPFIVADDTLTPDGRGLCLMLLSTETDLGCVGVSPKHVRPFLAHNPRDGAVRRLSPGEHPAERTIALRLVRVCRPDDTSGSARSSNGGVVRESNRIVCRAPFQQFPEGCDALASVLRAALSLEAGHKNFHR